MIKYLTYILLILLPLTMSGQDLETYLEEAAENNPGLNAKFKAYMAALEKTDQVKPLPDPQLAFGYFISPVETRVGPQKARISLSQMFPWFGTNSTKASIAELEAKARYEEFIDARNQLYYKVKDTWYELSALATSIDLNEENLEILRSFERIASSKFESGQTEMVDVIRVQMMIDDLETDLAVLIDRREPLRVRFNTLLNRETDAEVQVEDEIPVSDPDIEETDTARFADHPEIRGLDFSLQAANEREQLARLQGNPNIGVGLDYVIVGERNDVTLEDNGKNAFMPMLTLSLPIYRKKYKATRKEAVLMQESIAARQQETLNSLNSRYIEATWMLEKARKKIELLEDQIERADQAYSLLSKTYSAAGEDFEEVLRMIRQKLKYQLDLTEAEKEYLTAIARINWITAKN